MRNQRAHGAAEALKGVVCTVERKACLDLEPPSLGAIDVIVEVADLFGRPKKVLIVDENP